MNRQSGITPKSSPSAATNCRQERAEELPAKLIRRLIKESNLIENIEGPKEVIQSRKAWDFLIGQKDLSYGVICRVQSLITENHLEPPYRGYYRSVGQVNVRVGRHVPPGWPLVDGLMDNWLLDYAALAPFAAHCRFERIHPFVDGNGRTGRMLLWWQELGLGLEPALILAKHRSADYLSLDAKPR